MKSQSPALEGTDLAAKVKNEEISNASTKSNISTASTSDTIKSEIAPKFSGVSSDSEFGEDDSQSSSKTYGSDSLKTLANKLGEKNFVKALEKGKPKRVSEKVPRKGKKAAALKEKKNQPSMNLEKSIPKSVIEKSTAKMLPEKTLPKPPANEGVKELQVKLRDIRDDPPDVYEFKEPEPFEFEASPPTRKEFEKKARAATPPPVVVKQKKKKLDDDAPEDAFDVLRKSPSFKPLKEELTPLKDDPPASPLINKSAFMNTNVESSPELKSEKRKDEKAKISDLESVKKILTDPTFEPPKIEKPSSIAEKLLTVLSQKATEPKPAEDKSSSSSSSKPSTSLVAEPSLAFITKKPEMLKSSLAVIASLEPPPALPPPKIPAVIEKKALLVEKVDILESISPKNTELSETIQKLESAIQKSSQATVAAATRFDEDLSDSTDSEQSRLVIEDESQSSEYLTQVDPNELTTAKEPIEPPQVTTLLPVVVAPENVVDVPAAAEIEPKKKEEPPVVVPTSEPISMLLCEETIPGSPASGGIKDPELNRKPVYPDPAGFLVPPTEAEKAAAELAENSPRGSFSQDDSKSDSEKMVVDDFAPKKRRRARRTSETEAGKKRRGRGRNGKKKGFMVLEKRVI